MRVRAPRAAPAAALLILTALSACDNVDWGGSSVQIVSPPPPGGGEVEAPPPGTVAGLGMPSGPVLFHLVRTEGGTGQLVPVAEIGRDSLRTLRRPAGVAPEAYEQRFREAVIEPGAQFTLFRRGAEVGTFIVQEAAAVNTCGVPTATGQFNTVAAAAGEGEFLAFRKGLAPDVVGEYSPPQVEGTVRRYASLIAERLVLQNGLQRPRSWPGAQRDLQALDAVHGGHPEMAATYLVGDNLGVGRADPEGYSVFYVADYAQRTGYTPFYTEVRDYDKTGKGAPMVVDHLNWNGQGESEILVRVFGEREAWYEALSRDGGTWRKVWEGGRCLDAPPVPRDIGAAERTGQSR